MDSIAVSWKKPPILPDEFARQEELSSYQILDTETESAFDDLVKLASQVCGTPICMVTLVDKERQWFKSKMGVAITETPRDISFCGHAIAQQSAFIVPDATKDERFATNPLVMGEPFVRFYAGVPLEGANGHNLGVLCVLDKVPRELSPAQTEALGILARQVMAQIELRKRMRQLEQALLQRKHAEEALSLSEDRFRAFMDSSPMLAFMKDAEGRLVYYNQTCSDRFNISRDAWLGKTAFDLWPTSIAQEVQAHDNKLLAGESSSVLEVTAPGTDGQVVHWKSYRFPFVDGAGRKYIAGVALDVTHEKKTAKALHESEKRFRDLLDNMQEMVHSLSPDGKLLFANRAWREKLGYAEGEIQGLHISKILHPDGRQRNEKIFQRAILGEPFKNLPNKLITKDGTPIFVEADIAWQFENGKPVESRTLFRDVTERNQKDLQIKLYQEQIEEANRQLSLLAVTDELTGLKNRRALQVRLEEEFRLSRRYEHPLSLLMIDVDHFKKFNDTYGHLAGDEILKGVALWLRDLVRTTDLVARFGGEEFAVLLPNTDLGGALLLAERVRAAIARPRPDLKLVTISIGVSSLTTDHSDVNAFLSDADEALYQAKAAGRNCVLPWQCHALVGQ
jgi:diguanylate cyclase (GGDEF)-like protein/PAS domain S-box-containing protein